MIESPTFTQHEDGSITVDAFPTETMCTEAFLRTSLPRFVKRASFRAFTISCANASATYRLMSRNWDYACYLCRRIDAGA